MRHYGLDEAEMPHLQDIGMFEYGFRCQRIDIATTTLPCVVHQYVNATPGGRHFSHECINAIGIGHVNRPGNHRLGVFCEQFTCFADGCLTACTDCNPCPFSCERPGNGQAYAP
ncbi:hypothetical protein D3C76_1404260 [compost metagenome]